MKSCYQKHDNLKLIQVMLYPDRINLHKSASRITVQRPSSELAQYQPSPHQLHSKLTVSALLGIFDKNGSKFLLCAETVSHIGSIQGTPIYKITSVISFEITKFEQRPVLLLQVIRALERGFFFSFQKDLTRRYDHQWKTHTPSSSFMWGKQLAFSFQQLSSKWLPLLINGFVMTINWILKDYQMSLTLISRRSNESQGQLWDRSGLSDSDMVSNFMEHQLIVEYRGHIYSVVAVRGNVPLFWNLRDAGGVEMTRNMEMINVRFCRHFLRLSQNYGKIFAINLLEKSRESECLLSTHYQELIKLNLSQFKHFLRYRSFDIIKQYKKDKEHSINKLIKELSLAVNHFGMHYHSSGSSQIQSQRGVFRVNCLDGYSRSNFIVSRLLHEQLKVICRQIGQPVDDRLMLNYNYLWIRNHQELTRRGLYADQLKTGTQLKTLYFLQESLKFEYKNAAGLEAISLLSRNQNIDDSAPRVSSMLSVFILTWNINGTQAKDVDLTELLDGISRSGLPDILAFGLQEMVELNTTNILVTNSRTSASSDSWRTKIKKDLCSRCGMSEEEYLVVEQGDLVGLFNLVLIHSRIKHRISDIEVDIVKTGYGGKLGNKGAALIRFRIDSDLLTFINCHLQAGEKKMESRLHNIQDIHDKAFLNGKKKSTLLQSEYIFFYGDMNFRIARDDPKNVIHALNTIIQAKLESSEKKKVAKVIISSLKAYDQLLNNRDSCLLLRQYKQADIEFLPTYKFEKGGELYTTRKERCPSWCDRILVRSHRGCFIKKEYYSKSILLSDHHPVCGELLIEIEKKVM